VAEPIPEAEAYIQFRLNELASRNEHHRFEEIATRIARKRISSNILIATGPVSSGGDQQRDAETYTTRIPVELPHSAGFSASASTAPVVVACTVQTERLKNKVLDDLAGICAENADPVSHIAFFSVHAISEGITHDLKKTARATYGVTLDIFCGADIATFLAEPDLVWVARHYLDLPSSLVPPPEGDPAPEWYIELLERLRQNNGPGALTPATQGEVTQALRFAIWDKDANADLPEWLDFMGAFLADSDDGDDTELLFRACYEMAVARFRGMGTAAGVEDLVRRAIGFACKSSHPNVVDDAATLASYWGTMWISGVGHAEATEIAEALERLHAHVVELAEETDPATHPVRAASLTGTQAFIHLIPDWRKAEQAHGRPQRAEVASNVGEKLDESDIDPAAMAEFDLVDTDAAMADLEKLIDNLQPESSRECDDARNELVLLRGRAHRLDERPVQFDHVQGYVTQVAQRRVTGAEVVDRDPDTAAAQTLQVVPDELVVTEQKGLGDLQHQAVRAQAAACKQPVDGGGEVECAELAGRHVGGHIGQCMCRGARPLSRGAGRRRENPVPDRSDEPGLLGDVDELVGAQPSAGRGPPSAAGPRTRRVHRRQVRRWA
jgi:hypothetical protein